MESPSPDERPKLETGSTNQTKADASSNNIDSTAWDTIAETREFKELLSAKSKFIISATIFFIIYYFSLPLLVGYAPEMMARKVWGNVNIAYLFALSQFFMAWIIAGIYVLVAAGWDRRAAQIISRFVKN